MARIKKSEAPMPQDEPAIVIDMAMEGELMRALTHPNEPRAESVDKLTYRALTLRAKGVSEDDIAKSERVEASTLSAWLASPARIPTPEQSRKMMEEQIIPAAVEGHLHLVLAGNKSAIMQTMKDSGKMRPAKTEKSQFRIIVGVGVSSIGDDPIEAATTRVAVEVHHK